MRRLAPVVLSALAFAAPARAATLTISTADFSPLHTIVVVTAQLDAAMPAGVRLVHLNGRPVGWIDPQSPRTTISVQWNGTIAGRRVPDGRYAVQLVSGVSVLVSRFLRVDTHPPELVGLAVDDGSRPFAGDSKLLTTVSPNGDGFRDAAHIRFVLREPATVTMDVTRTVKVPHVMYALTAKLGRGEHELTWTPSSNLNPRTYLIRLAAVDLAGNGIEYGAPNAFVGRYERGVVVRIQGIDAGFSQPSYAPGQIAALHIATDEPALTYRVFQAGPETYVTYADNQMGGVPVDESVHTLDWRRWTSRPHTIAFRVPKVASGLYYVELSGPDGRIGYAPFVVRPAVLGKTSRVLVVLPTNTWQAYNFQDVDGNGYGDTWYAGPPNRSVALGRTYIARGVPPRYYRYDLPFLHWFYWGRHNAEFVSDSDFDRIRSGDVLAKDYDLIVFEGHEEYVTAHEYDVVRRFRDLGGNLMFLSANNFFWHVDKRGQVLRKIGEWRQAGRPEAALLGAAYVASDDGRHRGQYTVVDAAAAPWLWNGTGLGDGSTFGGQVGGFGIEIDAASPQSPPGTIVLAQIPDLLGAGKTAQMTYYELPNGAKVFDAGVLNFCGSVTQSPMKQMMDNLWAHLSAP
ncbi:MAG TPA: N,N-dimethylformamidase beta subunit family domain-containing protein [Gaiellaceae bacterium]|nr:N,N-dimethylformamidase beta subunit family domain-containing protein [Gaiellaceae bacterium]